MTSADWLSALRWLYLPNRVVTDAAEITSYKSDAQGMTAAPCQLLRAIPNVTLLEISHSEIFCGSAGTYNLEHPEVTEQLGQRKAQNILSIGCETIVAGNIGCIGRSTRTLSSRARCCRSTTPLKCSIVPIGKRCRHKLVAPSLFGSKQRGDLLVIKPPRSHVYFAKSLLFRYFSRQSDSLIVAG